MSKLNEFLNEQEMVRIYEEDENRPFEITYLQGMKSKRGRKTFKNRKEYEKWMEKYGDDISHEQWRYLDEETVNEAPIGSPGWTEKSVEKFGKTIGKDAKEKGFFDACVARMSGKEGFDADKAKGFCAAVKDKAFGSTYWRGKDKSKKEVDTATKAHPYKNESTVNEEKYASIVFIQNSDDFNDFTSKHGFGSGINGFFESSDKEKLEYLAQWDYGDWKHGEYDELSDKPWGTGDKVKKMGEYVLTYNSRLGYAGLYRVIK